jgi:hypothetical protein
MRQHLYFCTRKCVSICTFVLVHASHLSFYFGFFSGIFFWRTWPMYIIGVLTPTISTPPSARIDRKQEAFDIFFKFHKPSDVGATAEPDRAGCVSVFVLLYQQQQLRQYLHFCTSSCIGLGATAEPEQAACQYLCVCISSCVSICTFVLAAALVSERQLSLTEQAASVFVLLYQQLRQYLHFCTSSRMGTCVPADFAATAEPASLCVSICTFVPVKQVN